MTPRPTILALVLLLVASLVGGACGVPANDGPQAISPANLPAGLLDPNPGTSTTVPGSPGTTPVPVYFIVRDGDVDRLTEVTREVAEPTMPAARIGALFSQPTADEADAGITSSIPADLVLLQDPVLDEETGVLTIDLSSELFDIQSAELTRAVAQIVFTVTQLTDVLKVRFLVEGEATPVPDDDGVEKEDPVSKADYRSLDPDA